MITVEGPERYLLKCSPENFATLCKNGTARFSGAASKREQKLYVVSVAKEIIYVGATTQIMQTRMRGGWTAKGKSGYYGYRWRHEITEANLDIWLLTGSSAENSKQDIETIEAEVVYLVRNNGQWPRYQTEIHFHISDADHRKAAQLIYNTTTA